MKALEEALRFSSCHVLPFATGQVQACFEQFCCVYTSHKVHFSQHKKRDTIMQIKEGKQEAPEQRLRLNPITNQPC